MDPTWQTRAGGLSPGRRTSCTSTRESPGQPGVDQASGDVEIETAGEARRRCAQSARRPKCCRWGRYEARVWAAPGGLVEFGIGLGMAYRDVSSVLVTGPRSYGDDRRSDPALTPQAPRSAWSRPSALSNLMPDCCHQRTRRVTPSRDRGAVRLRRGRCYRSEAFTGTRPRMCWTACRTMSPQHEVRRPPDARTRPRRPGRFATPQRSRRPV